MISVRSEVQILPGPPMLLKRGCSSAGRAPALQAGGRRFESDHLHFSRFACANAPAKQTGGRNTPEGCLKGLRPNVSRRSESNRHSWFRVGLRCRRCLRLEAPFPGITGPGPVKTARGWIFVRVNQVLVRLWTYLLALSDRMLMASSERGDRSEATVVC